MVGFSPLQNNTVLTGLCDKATTHIQWTELNTECSLFIFVIFHRVEDRVYYFDCKSTCDYWDVVHLKGLRWMVQLGMVSTIVEGNWGIFVHLLSIIAHQNICWMKICELFWVSVSVWVFVEAGGFFSISELRFGFGKSEWRDFLFIRGNSMKLNSCSFSLLLSNENI